MKLLERLKDKKVKYIVGVVVGFVLIVSVVAGVAYLYLDMQKPEAPEQPESQGKLIDLTREEAEEEFNSLVVDEFDLDLDHDENYDEERLAHLKSQYELAEDKLKEFKQKILNSTLDDGLQLHFLEKANNELRDLGNYQNLLKKFEKRLVEKAEAEAFEKIFEDFAKEIISGDHLPSLGEESEPENKPETSKIVANQNKNNTEPKPSNNSNSNNNNNSKPQPKPETSKKPEKTPEPTKKPEKTPEPTKEPEKTPEPTKEPEKTPEPTPEPIPRPAYGTIKDDDDLSIEELNAHEGWKVGYAEYTWNGERWETRIFMSGSTSDSVREEYMQHVGSRFSAPDRDGEPGERLLSPFFWVFLGK